MGAGSVCMSVCVRACVRAKAPPFCLNRSRSPSEALSQPSRLPPSPPLRWLAACWNEVDWATCNRRLSARPRGPLPQINTGTCGLGKENLNLSDQVSSEEAFVLFLLHLFLKPQKFHSLIFSSYLLYFHLRIAVLLSSVPSNWWHPPGMHLTPDEWDICLPATPTLHVSFILVVCKRHSEV